MSTQLTTTAQHAVVTLGDAGERYRAAAAADAAQPLSDRFAAWLDGMTPCTATAYRGDLRRFADWLGIDGKVAPHGETADAKARRETQRIALALRMLVDAAMYDTAPQPVARMIERYGAAMRQRGASGKTIARAYAVLNGALRLLARAGIGPGPQDPELPAGAKIEQRSTVQESPRAGPGDDVVARMLRYVEARTDAISIRDAAIVALLARSALRRNEAVTLDVAHVDLSHCTVHILGKGRTTREAMSLARPTCAALARWLAIRDQYAPAGEPALFVSMDRGRVPARISGEAVRQIVQRIADASADAAKVPRQTVRPHGLRHTAATTLLRRNGRNLHVVQHVLRHRNVATTSASYDDAGREAQREGVDHLGAIY